MTTVTLAEAQSVIDAAVSTLTERLAERGYDVPVELWFNRAGKGRICTFTSADKPTFLVGHSYASLDDLMSKVLVEIEKLPRLTPEWLNSSDLA